MKSDFERLIIEGDRRRIISRLGDLRDYLSADLDIWNEHGNRKAVEMIDDIIVLLKKGERK